MRSLIFLATLIAGCTDHGECLQSHTEHVEQTMTFMYVPVGKSFVMVPITHPAHDETVCDKWER